MALCCGVWRVSLYNDFTLLLNLSKKHIVLLIVLVLLFSETEAQCAMCRAVLESEEGQSTAKGVNNGIVYLMVIPYVLIGGLAFYIYKKLSSK